MFNKFDYTKIKDFSLYIYVCICIYTNNPKQMNKQGKSKDNWGKNLQPLRPRDTVIYL